MKNNNSLVSKLFYILGTAVASCVAILLTTSVLLLTAKVISLLWTWLF